MKIIFTLFLISISILQAQTPQGFNYQSVVRDVSGDILSSQNISVQFELHQTTANGTVVYTETHLVTTNEYGLFLSVIGQGTTTDDFSTIDWSLDNYFIETSIDLTGGTTYTSLGATQLFSVPYALYALKSDTTNSVVGLLELDEGNGNGHRIARRDIDNYGNIGENAIDVSYSSVASSNKGATGSSSFASGFRTRASGAVSTAMGQLTNATGDAATAIGSQSTASGDFSTAIGFRTAASDDYSTALGYDTQATGNSSTAIGYDTLSEGEISTAMGSGTTATGDVSTAFGRSTKALGDESTAMGFSSEANGRISFASGFNSVATGMFSTAMGRYASSDSYGSFALGQYNIGGGDASTWVDTDALFEIGNGSSSSNLNNALTVLKNGNTTINGELETTQYKLSALNIAPASAADTGTTGEIRVTATHVYVCIATDTWVRTVLSTW